MTTQKEQLAKLNSPAEKQDNPELVSVDQLVDDNSPLFIIRKKEVDLKEYLIKTRSQADKILVDVKKEAEQLKEKLAAEGEKEAQQHYEKELSKLIKQADELRSQAPAKAKEAQEIGLKNLDKTINHVNSILVPKH